MDGCTCGGEVIKESKVTKRKSLKSKKLVLQPIKQNDYCSMHVGT